MKITEKQLIEWKNQISDVFSVFIKICNENNLRYFCNGGTAIGTIRHHGIIPWDDDIDVMMPRPDYNKFIDICEKTDIGSYEIITPNNNENYYCTYAKFCNTTSTLLETEYFRCVLGMFIDIFPLDGVPEDEQELLYLFQKYQKYRKIFYNSNKFYSFSKFFEFLYDFKWKQAIGIIYRHFFRKIIRAKALAEMNRISSKYEYGNSDKIVEYDTYLGLKGVMEKNWFDSYVLMDFEGYRVRMPSSYDNYLKHFFGDYMCYPPVDQQCSNHYVAFVDLNKRIPIKDILRQLNV